MPVERTWETVELPILEAIWNAEEVDVEPNDTDLAETLGIDLRRVRRALEPLAETKHIECVTALGGTGTVYLRTRLLSAGRRAIGQWPGDTAAALESTLAWMIANEPDPEQRSKLRAAGKALADIGKGAAAQIGAAIADRAGPLVTAAASAALRLDCVYRTAPRSGELVKVEPALFDTELQITTDRFELGMTFDRLQPNNHLLYRIRCTASTTLDAEELGRPDGDIIVGREGLWRVEEAVQRVVDAVRVGQPWSGLVGAPLELEESSVEVDGHRRSMIRWDRNPRATVSSGPTFTVAEAEAALHGDAPPLDRVLLAEAAWHGMWCPIRRPSQAVVVAAAACEVAAKRRLVEVASSEVRPLLEHILNDRRNLVTSAQDLFGKVAELVTGQPFDRAAEMAKLFELRNKVMHTARPVDEETARDLISTAWQAVRWLRELQPQGS